MKTDTLTIIINGWNMPAAAIEPIKQELVKLSNHSYEIINIIDLPLKSSDLTIDYQQFFCSLKNKIANHKLHLIGWSMGGNIATKIAKKFNSSVKSLVLISSNPCFVSKSDWQGSMPANLFSKFKQAVKDNPIAELASFVKLCTLGNNTQRSDAKKLQQSVTQDNTKLLALLAELENLDTRNELSEIYKPILHLLGTKDMLVPIKVAQKLTRRYPKHLIASFNGGHSFFLNDIAEISENIHQFQQASLSM